MGYWTNNYSGPGGDELHVGGKLIFDNGAKVEGLMPNQAPSSASSVQNLKNDLNALIVKLKDSGLMAPDELTIVVVNTVNDTAEANADRQYNTGKISSVAIANDVITITLSEKVKDLKSFDGLNGWGVHKWLGIGVSAGISPITDLYYKGTKLTADDVTEATGVGLSAGYFVRWVAADLALHGNSNKFTLKADGYREREITIKIVEPTT